MIDFWRNDVIPLTFHEKTRMLLTSSSDSGSGVDAGDSSTEGFGEAIFRLFAGGGLISPPMVE